MAKAKNANKKSRQSLLWRIVGVLSLCAVIVTGVVFAIPSKSNDADAWNTSNSITINGDIFIGDTKSKDFDGNVLDEIYNHLVGKNGAT